MPKKKVTVLIDEDEYRKLRALLILRGKTFSSWIREVISNLINE